eukprot:3783254-Karenia_brevis.AAC.1
MSEDEFEEENDALVADVDEFEQALTAVSFDEMHPGEGETVALEARILGQKASKLNHDANKRRML